METHEYQQDDDRAPPILRGVFQDAEETYPDLDYRSQEPNPRS